MCSQTNPPTLFRLVPFAREQRKHPTRSEAMLWGQLRKRKLGVRFRRQHPFEIGFVVDFYAACSKLVVEVDGGVHDEPEQAQRDAMRQAAIERTYGVRFVRVSAELVERDVLAAVDLVRLALA
jgi:leucyl-tRNA synthetase